MARPPGRPLAHNSALKPFGSLSLLSGISLAGVSVILPACGASFDSAIFGPLPWCHAGGGPFLSCAWTANDAAKAAATAAATSFFMCFIILDVLLELKLRLDTNGHVALRRRLVVTAVGLVHDHRAGVLLVE